MSLRSETDLEVAVYGQTVPGASYLEHASLGLVLEYGELPFDTEDSFVGAAPGGATHGAWPATVPELVMLVDASGVYVDDAGWLIGVTESANELPSADTDSEHK